MSDIDKIQNALSHIDPHDRDLWLRMGAAIKDELGDNGFDVWDQWSETATNYNSKAAKATWKSLKPGHVRINSVFYEAIQHGYKPVDPYTPLSPEEQSKRRAEAEQRQLQEVEQQKQAQAKAKQTAQYIWKEKTTAASLSHPYLIAKGITDLECIRGLKQNIYDGHQNLVIPMYQNREIVSLQFINQDGAKRYLSDGQKDSSYSLIGDAKKMADGFYMAEGFATAASIYEATGKPVVVTFDAGNLVNVAESLKQTYPNAEVTIAADHDVSETGMIKAQEAAAVLGEDTKIVLPYFTIEHIERYQQQHGVDNLPSDFNDLHALAGLNTVKSFLTGDKIPIMEPEKTAESQQAADQAAFLHPEAQKIPSAEPQTVPEASPVEPQPGQEPEVNSIELDLESMLEVSAKGKPAAEVPPETPVSDQSTSESWVSQVRSMFSSKKQSEPEPISNQELKKIITDLNYRTPPEGMEQRYLVSNGQYLSASNASTVIFEDKGKSLSTARTDTQIAQDMLDVAKNKGWDAIKLSGTKEFKQIMYVLAESQGVRTKGYSPTEADKTLVERLRVEHSLNRVEEDASQQRQEPSEQTTSASGDQQPDQMTSASPAGEKILSYGHAPYLHDPENKESYYLTLEKNGNERTVWGVGLPEALEKSQVQIGDSIELKNLGKHDVEVDVPIKDENDHIIGTEKILTHRNVWEVDVLARNQELAQEAQQPPETEQHQSKPDVAAISEAEKIKLQAALPTSGQIETSPKADTDIDVPMQEIGQGSIPGEVQRQTQEIKTHALDTDTVTTAKNNYDGKAEHLSKPNKAKLKFFERNTMYAIQDLKGDARKDALRNYYDYMSSKMDSNQLDLPSPMQIPSPAPLAINREAQKSATRANDQSIER